MLRPPALLLSLALMTGCGGRATPLPPAAPVTAAASAPAAPGTVQIAEISILGVTPGKTTLEEFKTRFKVAEVKETEAQGVVTAEAGPGAVLQGDGIRSDSLVAASIDGVVFDVKLQTVEDQSAMLEKLFGKPTAGKSGALTWKAGDLNVIHFPESKALQMFDARKGLEAKYRGYKPP